MTERNQEQPPQSSGRYAFLVPLAWIGVLLFCYWLLADWRSLPALISAGFAAIG